MDPAQPQQAPLPYWFRPRCPEGTQLPVLQEETFRSQDNTLAVTLSVTAAALSYRMNSSTGGAAKRQDGVARTIPLDFVLAASVSRATLEVSHYPIDEGAVRTRCTTVFKLSSEERAQSWRATITSLLVTGTPKAEKLPRRHVLVLVNPFSGTKKAGEVWEKEVAPVFAEAGLTCQVMITQFSGHAYQIANTFSWLDYDAICIVSGDGLIFETLNGLMARPDWEQAAKLPLLLVPGGSGNALCFSMYGCVDPTTAAFICARGRVKPLDCASVVQKELRCISFLMTAWGLVSDVDFESERWRWMGSARFTVGAIQRIASLRLYKGKFDYYPAAPTGQPLSKCVGRGCTVCLQPEQAKRGPGLEIQPLDQRVWPKGQSLMDMMKGQKEGPPTPLLDALRGGDDHGWVHEEGDAYVLFVAALVTHISSDMCIAPYAHTSDGCFDIVVMKNVGKFDMAKMLMSAEKGEHVSHPGVTYLKARALRLVPDPSPPSPSLLDVDGERLPYQATEVETHRGLLNVASL